MMYTSTRDKTKKAGPAQAITLGASVEGGLFVPESLPELTPERLEKLTGMDCIERTTDIMGDFLTDFTREEILSCVTAAYATGRFEDDKIAPIAKLSDDLYMLELWHGPTCAFKDMALQLLPHLLTLSAKKQAKGKEIAILTATSGDTGKAALEGFRDVAGTKILVFYPEGGVSEIQRLQMTTQEGENVGVCAVDGNFDDTQTYMKRIFADTELREKLAEKNIMLSSANSINWGRLMPQICYYVGAYCDLVTEGELKQGDTLDICVPTGNFGNILAAYYAKKMGLPLGKLVCASNTNNVLTDFINTGTYDRRREFILTSSPSMDILVSSNLERLLFALHGEDDGVVRDLMAKLSSDGFYAVDDNVRQKLTADFYGGFCDEQNTAATVKETFEKYSYLCDTHTAVALYVAKQYMSGETQNKMLVVSTASPYKFAGSILFALTGKDIEADEFTKAEKLAEITNTQIPEQISQLAKKTERFTGYRKKSEMRDYVCEQLGI